MQNRYTGDIGDFGKYGLLRTLCGDDLSLGVVWYLYPDEEDNGDGGHTDYLEPTAKNLRKFRDCAPLLYDTLQKIVRDGRRSIQDIREQGVLPPGTIFYEKPLSFVDLPEEALRRSEHRKAWAWDALEKTRDCDIIFVDPDNGLEGGKPSHYQTSPKFAYFDELYPYLDRGQSLIIYHHLHRSAPTEDQVRERLSQMNERLGKTFALRYWRGSPRSFFVVPSKEHRETLRERARHFTSGPWHQHFSFRELYEDVQPLIPERL